MSESSTRRVARKLALVALAGPWERSALLQRLASSFESVPRCRFALVRFLLRSYNPAQAAALTIPGLAATIGDAEHLWPRMQREQPVVLRHIPLTQMPLSPPRLVVANLPALPNIEAVAQWLELTPGETVWLADEWNQEARRADGPQRHYRYRWLAREYGTDRLIQMPKQRLREAQRRLYEALLRHVPVHAAAQGFVRGRSTLTHARQHVGHAWVLRLDLAQFFCHIARPRVQGVFAMLGYAPAVARCLAALCTNRVPTNVLQAAPHGPLPWSQRLLFRDAHLPQGAPTSPALANLVAFGLDVRLAALARKLGATYTRYADDLTFSHPDWQRADAMRCARVVARIVADCGLRSIRARRCTWARIRRNASPASSSIVIPISPVPISTG
jgi:RNA-directed DNA polymerase